MAISEEEQMKAMLAEMGMDSMDELGDESEDSIDSRPIPEGPVKRPSSIDESNSQETADLMNVEMQATEVKPQTENRMAELETAKVEAISDPSPIRDVKAMPATGAQHRDLTVNALLHLMGLPTGSQLSVLDSKLDLVMTKLTTLSAKIDRMNSQFELLSSTSATERLEFQVSEIRSIMKKFFPQAFSGAGMPAQATKLSPAKSPVVVQSSEPATAKASAGSDVKETPKKETSVHVDIGLSQMEEEEEPLSDEDYQVLEAQKLREQVKNENK